MKYLMRKRMPKEERQQQSSQQSSIREPPALSAGATPGPPAGPSFSSGGSVLGQQTSTSGIGSTTSSSSSSSSTAANRPQSSLPPNSSPATSAGIHGPGSESFSASRRSASESSATNRSSSPSAGGVANSSSTSSRRPHSPIRMSASTGGGSPSPRHRGSLPVVSNGTMPAPGTVSATSSVAQRNSDEYNPFNEVPLLRESPTTEHHDLFVRKLRACCLVLDFTKPTHLMAKEAKRQTLLELVEYVNSTPNCFTEPVMSVLIQMVSANIFRSLPPPSSTVVTVGAYDPEDDEPQLESAWPHLQIVYELFLRFVVSTDVEPKAARKQIDQQFVLKLLELFSSEDPRERDYLKTILHRIYGKIMALRSFIRKAIQHVFFRFTYENEGHKGISELLEILGSIINGFALPLKDEHKAFLEKSLIPLHKARSLSAFNQQLTYCMTQYVEKDCRLAEPVIMGLLRYWPVTNTNKEAVFLNELEEILELTQAAEFQKVMHPLFRRLAACIQSPHFQVAERVLFLWNNEYIVSLFNNHKQQLFPLVIAALYRNSKEHWNTTVHGLTYNVSKLLAEADPKLFDDCSDRNVVAEEQKQREREEREKKWEELEAEFHSKAEK